MSNQQGDTARNNGDEQKEQKVIVVAIKDMPSFGKMEFKKDILGTSNITAGTSEGIQSIFNLKPQQLLPSASTLSTITQPKSGNVQVQQIASTVQLSKNVGGNVLIRQRNQPLLISQKPPTVVSSKPIISSASQIYFNAQQKTFQLVHNVPQKPPLPTVVNPSLKITQKIPPRIVQIPKQSQTPPTGAISIVNQQNQLIFRHEPPLKTTKIIAVPPQIKIQPKSSSNIYSSVPPLAPIQQQHQQESKAEYKILMEKNENNDEFEDYYDEEETFQQVEVENSSKSIEEEYLNVKRIIEGDEGLNNYVVSQSNNGDVADSHNIVTEKKELEQIEIIDGDDDDDDEEEEEVIAVEQEEEEEETKKDKVDGELKSEISEQQAAMSSDSLLCDEQIISITPEISPDNNDKSKELSTTPKQETETATVTYKPKSMTDVKRTLNLDIIPSHGSDEKISLKIDIEEEDSVMSEDTTMLNKINDNDDDSLHSKSEISLNSSENQSSKRIRKPKQTTLLTNIELPFKPQPVTPGTNSTSNNNSRKRRSEKKMELEHDFHDPLNKIQWEEGIGGLNNCGKLFGFDDFGFVEVITKKDAKAILNRNEDKNIESNCSFKFKKILDPEDQFVCVVCSKMGTIRDFFAPECCSEACLAITKRKGYEYGREDQDSTQNSPNSDAKKISYGGEMVSLQQLQIYLLKQKLPGQKKLKNVSKINQTPSDERFSWNIYLTPKSIPAPLECFRYTSKQPNIFKVGMKLEAIDPMNQNLFCVCTVEERLGHRIKLHFDGYPTIYDFWINAGSKNIFPIDFCHSTKRELQVPPKWTSKNFDWSEYLDDQNSIGVQKQFFPNLKIKQENIPHLEIGMKLEVRKDDHWYAGTIADILQDRMLIKFDGFYKNNQCVWHDFNSISLNPCDAYKTLNSATFLPPFGDLENFYWDQYLLETNSKCVPMEFFKNRTCVENKFEPGMKLEVVDKINPQLIRPATILSRNDYKIQVNFDGFDISYAFWLDYDSENIYPINFCSEMNHPIEFPAGYNRNDEFILCSTAGCRGIGNGIHPDRYFHENDDECPYNKKNWKRLMEETLPSRLDWKPTLKRQIKPLTRYENGNNDKVRPTSARLRKEAPKEEVQIIEDVPDEIEKIPVIVKSEPGKRGRKRKIPLESSSGTSTPAVLIEEVETNNDAKIRVVEQFLANYGPQLQYSFNLWTLNSKVLDKAAIRDNDYTTNPLNWSVDDVCTYIVKYCTEEITAKFYAQKIDGEALLSLCQKDLIDLMDIKIGPAIKIYNRILHLRHEVMTKFLEI